MKLRELHAIMTEFKNDQAPGSEPSWWEAYGEDIRQHCGVLPWGDYEDDVEVPASLVAGWLAPYIDWAEAAGDSKSHTAGELRERFMKGEGLWLLDTFTSGNDDLLLGESEEEVRGDVVDWLQTHTPPVEEIPEDWSLTELGAEELLDRYPMDPRWINMSTAWEHIASSEDLAELTERLNEAARSCPEELYDRLMGGTSDLPRFGGPDIDDTEEIWSWDATQLLCNGDDISTPWGIRSSWAVEPRTDKASLRAQWEASSHPIMRVLDDEGEWTGEGRVRRISKEHLIYVDDVDGWGILGDDEFFLEEFLSPDRDEDQWTIPEAAEVLGVTPQHARLLAKEAEVGRKTGRDWVLTADDVDRLRHWRRGGRVKIMVRSHTTMMGSFWAQVVDHDERRIELGIDEDSDKVGELYKEAKIRGKLLVHEEGEDEDLSRYEVI